VRRRKLLLEKEQVTIKKVHGNLRRNFAFASKLSISRGHDVTQSASILLLPALIAISADPEKILSFLFAFRPLLSDPLITV